jgi:hypothetical protein
MKTTKLVVAALAALISASTANAAAPSIPDAELAKAAVFLPYTAGLGDPLDLTRPAHGKRAIDMMKTGTVPAKRSVYHMPYTGGLGDPDDLTRPIYK